MVFLTYFEMLTLVALLVTCLQCMGLFSVYDIRALNVFNE